MGRGITAPCRTPCLEKRVRFCIYGFTLKKCVGFKTKIFGHYFDKSLNEILNHFSNRNHFLLKEIPNNCKN